MGGGIRSLNVALRQELDLYVPAPRAVLQGRAIAAERALKDQHGHLPRELRKTSTRALNSPPNPTRPKKLIAFLQNELGATKIRFPNTSGIGIKPVSREGTERLIRKAIQYAIDHNKSPA